LGVVVGVDVAVPVGVELGETGSVDLLVDVAVLVGSVTGVTGPQETVTKTMRNKIIDGFVVGFIGSHFL
jgi:hypothetical protein